MKIEKYDEKIKAIRRFRASKDGRAEKTAGEGMSHFKLWFDGEEIEFQLSGNEMVQLLSDFPEIQNIDELFSK